MRGLGGACPVPLGFLCDDRISSSCSSLCRLWLGNSPQHRPQCGLSSWPHRTPTPRAASRPGYGLAHLLPAHLALGGIWGLASWVSHEAPFWHM